MNERILKILLKTIIIYTTNILINLMYKYKYFNKFIILMNKYYKNDIYNFKFIGKFIYILHKKFSFFIL